jgi:Flp pilus assembly protein TadG
MIHRKSEKGQALIIITFAIIGLIGLTGLAVDGSLAYANQRKAQSSADTAAYAAALATIRGKNANEVKAAAKSIAAANGGSDINVEVNNPPGLDCKGKANSFANSNEYIQVIIKSKSKTSFGTIVGVKEVNNCAEAITHVTPYKAGGGSSYGGSAIVSTATSGSQVMLLNGNAVVKTTGTGAGVWVNSNNSQALFVNGGTSLTMAGPAQVVGGYGTNGGAIISPSVVTGKTQLTMPDPAWASIPAIPTTPTCSGNGTKASGNATIDGSTPPKLTLANGNNATINPGNWGDITLGNNVTLTFNPGNSGPGIYCFKGNVNFNGSNGVVSMPSGQIQLVMNNGINLGGVSLTATDLEIYTTNADLSLQASATVNATRFRFYSSGTSKLTVNSQSTLTSSNAHIRLTSGAPVWNGDSNINLVGPPSGDPLAGLTFYMPWSNTSPVNVNGGSTVNITGTMLMPHSDITANGGAGFAGFNSQIIGSTFKFNGGGDFTVNYNPSQNYGASPAEMPTIELIK